MFVITITHTHRHSITGEQMQKPLYECVQHNSTTRLHKVAVSEADSAGWMLISTINLLAAEGETLVEVIIIIITPSIISFHLHRVVVHPRHPADHPGRGDH